MKGTVQKEAASESFVIGGSAVGMKSEAPPKPRRACRTSKDCPPGQYCRRPVGGSEGWCDQSPPRRRA